MSDRFVQHPATTSTSASTNTNNKNNNNNNNNDHHHQTKTKKKKTNHHADTKERSFLSSSSSSSSSLSSLLDSSLSPLHTTITRRQSTAVVAKKKATTATTATASAHSTLKRKRHPAGAAAAGAAPTRTTTRRSAIPPPPEALIALLRTDAKVLHYFQALQRELDADVQKYKIKANQLQYELDTVKRQQQQQEQQQRNGQPPEQRRASRSRKSRSKRAEKERTPESPIEGALIDSPTKQDATQNHDHNIGNNNNNKEDISDSMLDQEFAVAFSSSDDDDDDDNLDIKQHQTDRNGDNSKRKSETVTSIAEGSSGSSSSSSEEPTQEVTTLTNRPEMNNNNDMCHGDDESEGTASPSMYHQPQQIFRLLHQAYAAFQQLGIALTTTTTTTDEAQSIYKDIGTTTTARQALGAVEETTTTTWESPSPSTVANKEGEKKGDNQLQSQRPPDGTIANSSDNPQAAVPWPAAELAVRPRSNEEVAADILHTIKELTRFAAGNTNVLTVPANGGQLLHPHHDQFIPCCNPRHPVDEQQDDETLESISVCHPALQGKRLLFRALVIVDQFCSPNTAQDEWQSYFVTTSGKQAGDDDDDDNDKNEDEMVRLQASMRVGLYGRQQLVQELLESLDAEISYVWAGTDRSIRHKATSLLFSGDGIMQPEHLSAADNHGTIEWFSMTEEVDWKFLGGDTTTFTTLLAERSFIVQLVLGLYLSRHQLDAALDTVIQYILSTAPSRHVEDYPRHYPVLSLVVLESLLRPDMAMMWWTDGIEAASHNVESWFIRALRISSGVENCATMPLLQGLSDVINETALIWKQRVASLDGRIHDVALVELASYDRLRQRESSWLTNPKDNIYIPLPTPKRFQELDSLITPLNSHHDQLALQLELIRRGTMVDIEERLRANVNIVESSKTRSIVDNVSPTRYSILACVQALRQLFLRQIDVLRDSVGTPGGMTNNNTISVLRSATTKMVEGLESVWNKQHVSTGDMCLWWQTTLEAAAVLSDGVSVVRTMQFIFRNAHSLSSVSSDTFLLDLKGIFDNTELVGQLPLLRVINLERRRDRLAAFAVQALQEGVLWALAVGRLSDNDEMSDPKETLSVGDEYGFGGHAFDGQGRLAESQIRITEETGSTMTQLNKLVASQWRPHDLKPFDRDAPDHDNLVLLSPTERACALSHIASWKGALRSFQGVPDALDHNYDPRCQSSLFRYPSHLLRLFKISGFAEGPALLPENGSMPPMPVCVIVEDDAILVDRFVERLELVLKDLPRDFHFCSLGYSRPKSAPIVPYTDQVGIPTMLWYLTGYVISQAGAQYLLNALPVIGPIDSWIGLRMTNNWDNTYGVQLGVGVHARPHSALPSRQQLRQILSFRAFCSLSPLCWQRVGGGVPRITGTTTTIPNTSSGSTTHGTEQTWRQRDTDIEYSGSKYGRVASRTTWTDTSTVV